MAFDISYERGQDLKVSLMGDLDITTVEGFKTSLISEFDNEPKDLVLNMQELDYIDSTGLGAIMTVYKHITDEGKSLSIVNAKRNIMKLFKITELDKLFNLED